MISIIIPIYREQSNAQYITERLYGLSSAKNLITEILWVQSEGEIYPFPTLISPKRQRSTQLNLGAQQAKGELLLFLHADTQLPYNALTYIAEHRQGAFSLAFDSNAFSAKIISLFTNLRAKITKIPYGDQAFFMPKTTFDKVGGFDDVPILEDVLMAKKVNLPISNNTVKTSFRRYQQNGVIKTVLKHRYIMLKYLLGSSPKALVKLRK